MSTKTKFISNDADDNRAHEIVLSMYRDFEPIAAIINAEDGIVHDTPVFFYAQYSIGRSRDGEDQVANLQVLSPYEVRMLQNHYSNVVVLYTRTPPPKPVKGL
jgi:hypothetical protein